MLTLMLRAIRQLFRKKTNRRLSDYLRWRDGVFTVPASQVDVLTDQPNQVYGVIMDVGISNDFTITIIAFPTGESSLLATVGGGAIGLGSNEYIGERAKRIVMLAQPLIEKTRRINNHNLPKSNQVYFYFLTTSGLMRYETTVNEANAKTHPFHEMFRRFTEIKVRYEELSKATRH